MLTHNAHYASNLKFDWLRLNSLRVKVGKPPFPSSRFYQIGDYIHVYGDSNSRWRVISIEVRLDDLEVVINAEQDFVWSFFLFSEIAHKGLGFGRFFEGVS